MELGDLTPKEQEVFMAAYEKGLRDAAKEVSKTPAPALGTSLKARLAAATTDAEKQAILQEGWDKIHAEKVAAGIRRP